MIEKNKRFILSSFLKSTLILFVFYWISYTSLEYAFNTISWVFYSTLVSFLLVLLSQFLSKIFDKNLNYIVSYFLFFLISISTIFKYTAPMTGAINLETNQKLFGLSFYTVALAYYINKNEIKIIDVFIISNPLLLFSGPLALIYKNIIQTNLNRRIKIFFPYIIIGVFFLKIVASPLTPLLVLKNETNIINVIIFGIIFEIFVYFNFAGISLLMYGLFGIIGILIPLNFRQPFSSRNLIEFWKGWHISLSNVLKELFYNPTKKILNSNIAIIVVFIGSAMWHGITINFFIWGVFHGILYLITKQIIKYKKNNFLPQIIMIFTIIFGRIIFSENNSRRLMQKMCFSIVNSNISALSIFTKYSSLSLFLGLIIVISEYLFYNQTYYKQRNYKYLRTPIMQIIIILMIFFLISNGVNYAVYGQR